MIQSSSKYDWSDVLNEPSYDYIVLFSVCWWQSMGCGNVFVVGEDMIYVSEKW